MLLLMMMNTICRCITTLQHYILPFVIIFLETPLQLMLYVLPLLLWILHYLLLSLSATTLPYYHQLCCSYTPSVTISTLLFVLLMMTFWYHLVLFLLPLMNWVILLCLLFLSVSPPTSLVVCFYFIAIFCCL